MWQHSSDKAHKSTALHNLYKGLCNAVFLYNTVIFLFVALFLLPLSPSAAQSSQKLTIMDATTHEAVAFANIQFGQQQQGTVSNISGQFNLPNHSAIDTLRISCLGYQTSMVATRNLANNSTIWLKPVDIALSEVRIVPGENPAHRIIRQVIHQRPKNNPDLNTSYSCLVYHKMTFAMEMPDTLPKGDEAHRRLWEFNKDNHFLLIESVSDKKHLPPDRSHERIISGRVSGFKEPSIALLPSQLQPFTFYNDYIHLLGTDFLNPLTQQGLRTYLFLLEDTLVDTSGDTIFYISYSPRKNSSIRGLKGSLHIHQPTWGLKTVTAATLEGQSPFALSIKQNYARHNEEQWFPEQLETRLRIDKTLTGKSFPFPFIGEGKSMVTAIKLDPDLSDKDFSSIELSDESGHVNAPNIENYRYQPLTARDSATYHLIDSLGRAHNFDRFTNLQKNLIRGYLPMGPLNLNLSKLIDYNQYEGLKPGVGLQTSKQLSAKFSLEGFYSRSLKSRDNNYGGEIILYLNPIKEKEWSLLVEKDLNATGAYTFLDGFSINSDERFRRFAVQTVDLSKQIRTAYAARFVPRLKTELFYRYAQIHPFIAYPFILDASVDPTSRLFTTHETGVLFKWQPLAKFAYSDLGLTPLKNEFPTVWSNFSYGRGMADQSLEYYKVETQLENTYRLSPSITGSVRMTGGHLWGNHTPTHLYSAFGTHNNLLGIESRYSLATMRPNEFAANTFSLLFLRTTIPTRLNHPGSFKPTITLSTSAGWANVNNNYANKVQTFNKGYYESGIYFGNLFKQMILKYGLAVHYRYGPYRLPKEMDNWSFKFGLEIGI